MQGSLLAMKNISKSFPGVKALDNVSFDLNSGEVHALIGENGAGKSTLMKVLTGIWQADQGEIYLKGKRFRATGPRNAQDNGISIIHQELNLLPDLTVADNIFVTREPRKFGDAVINDKLMYKLAQAKLDELGLKINCRTRVDDLSVAEMQMIEIAKALVVESDVLVLDEPTSALTESEVQKLFEIIHQLKAQGVGIVYISHRLEEFEHIVDRVTVLRDGKYIDTKKWAETSLSDIICMMVGRPLTEKYPPRNAIIGDSFFEARNITCGHRVRNVSLKLRKGEILGLAGLMGAGRTELARAIFGADHRDAGEILMDGKPVHIQSTADALKYDIAYLSEDRKFDGLFLGLEVSKNIVMANLPNYARLGVVDDKKCIKDINLRIQELRIKTPSTEQIVSNLSGGNQQKVLISRWLCKHSRIMIFDEPTRGIDVGAKFEVYSLMNKLAEKGIGIIMISSEMPEILGMSDRILVMCEGVLTGELSRAEATQEKIMLLASSTNEQGESA